MDTSSDERLTELEIRLALQDDLLDELNLVVSRQQQQMEVLARELRRLQELVRGLEPSKSAGPQDEAPPHY